MIVQLAVYFDGSGTAPEHPVWAIGGWIAEVDQWTQFCREWHAMIENAPFRDGVKRMFHAADLESLKGIYSDWTQDQKQTFQDKAYRIIEDFQLTPVASALIKADYEALKIRFAKFEQAHGGNYFVHTFHAVMDNVRKWLDARRYEASVHYVFEAGDIGDVEIKRILQRIYNDPKEREVFRMNGWTMTGKEVLPLQAADIWAYESYKQMTNRIVSGQIRKIRYPYKRLYRSDFEKYQTYWDRENLTELIATYRELEKRGGNNR